MPCRAGSDKVVFEAQTVRDEIVARLRLVQGQNMHSLVIAAAGGLPDGSRFAPSP